MTKIVFYQFAWFNAFNDTENKNKQALIIFDEEIEKLEDELEEIKTKLSVKARNKLTAKAKLAKNVDVDMVYKSVVKDPEESALEVHEQKEIPGDETVDINETLLYGSHYVKNVAFDNLPMTPISSFQEDLEVTRKILILNGFQFKTKKSPDIKYVKDETVVNTVVEEHDVSTVFDFETSDANVETEKLERFVEVPYEN